MNVTHIPGCTKPNLVSWLYLRVVQRAALREPTVPPLNGRTRHRPDFTVR